MTESQAATLLHKHFPYCVLSEVPLFRPDTSESHLYAHQLDFLLHLKKGSEEKLVIIECKDNILKGRKGGRPISKNSKRWVAQYFGTTKDARKQVRSQTRALFQNLDLLRNGQPPIEGWIVHAGRHSSEIRLEYDDGVTLIALTSKLLRTKLEEMEQEGWHPYTIFGSKYLWQLQLGRNEQHLPHPAFRDALAHVRNCRRAIDSGVFVQLRVGKVKRSNWAISGSAGSGKSVLLAYSACVFATDQWIQRGPNGSILKVLLPVQDRLPAKLPGHTDRKICVFAMSDRQVEALQRYFNRFQEEFNLLAGANAPQWSPIQFGKWNGEIPSDCNIMLIDEAQDLSLEDQNKINQWHTGADNHYLAVSIDRHQQLRQSTGTPKIIEGMNFSGKTTPMTRSYRQPFPAAISGTALLFRWLSKTGPMIRTDKEQVRIQRNSRNSLIGCYGARVTTHNDLCTVTMKNDSHPGNHWRRTVDHFEEAEELLKMLHLQQIDPASVLWIRFPEVTDSIPLENTGFHYIPISGESVNDVINREIKGMEHPVVVIEGMPGAIDDVEHEDQMWQARRQVYLCASRATAFLYFVLQENHNSGIYNEVLSLTRQLREPVPMHQRGKLLPETWRMMFEWRPSDIIGVPDFEDARPDENELTELEVAEHELSDTGSENNKPW